MVGLLNDVRKIALRPTSVAMATKFEIKCIITEFVYEISPRSLHLAGAFGFGY